MRVPLAAPLVLIVLLVATACSAGGPPADSPSPTDSPSPVETPGADASESPPAEADAVLHIDATGSAGGPGISVQEALESELDQPLLINGSVFIDADGNALLCDAIAESFPPQCAGARLAVEGLSIEMLAPGVLQEEGEVRWAEQVQLFGTVER